jgi:hypothetical protein
MVGHTYLIPQNQFPIPDTIELRNWPTFRQSKNISIITISILTHCLKKAMRPHGLLFFPHERSEKVSWKVSSMKERTGTFLFSAGISQSCTLGGSSYGTHAARTASQSAQRFSWPFACKGGPSLVSQ